MPEQITSPDARTEFPLEIAHLLFIDVVGYSKLLVNEQVEVTRQLNRLVRATESFRRAEAERKLIRLPTGDGMVLLFFRSPEEPVKCALELTEALRDYPNIQLRMGVHSGPVNQVLDVNDQINMAGTAINVGQRVMDCGDAGHILISKHVADDLGEFSHWRPWLHDLGECEVKHGLRLHIFNLAKDNTGNLQLPQKFGRSRRWKPADRSIVKPVKAPIWPKAALALATVLSLAAVGVSLWLLLSRKPSGPKDIPLVPEKSIAVLPFENRSDDQANAYFADAIQDEILTRLSKIADLKVISRTSTQHYKSTQENLRVIGRELGVAHIVEGSVQKNGDTVRVNVQLIKVANDYHVWANTFDRQLTDILSVESDVARTIADQLRVHITGTEQQAITLIPTNNPQAYNAYLRGLAYTLQPGTTPGSTVGAQKFLREAVRLDPKFAMAWALLSYVDAISLYTFSFESTADLMAETRNAAEIAIQLQPNLGEAYLAKGYYYFASLKEYGTAVYYFEKAREMLPNNSRIPEALAYVARRQNDWNRSDLYFKDAEHLDPKNANLLTQHALSYVHCRKFGTATEMLDDVLKITPGDVDTISLKAAVALAGGDLDHAASLLRPLRPETDHSSAVEVQVYYSILQRRPLQTVDRLKKLLKNPDPALGYINAELRFWLGWAQDVAGDHASAVESFQQARRELEGFVKQQPQNCFLISDLALACSGLGDRACAFEWANRALKAVPLETDAVSGPIGVELLARVAAQFNQPAVAIDALEKILDIPGDGALGVDVPMTRALLRLDPMFDPIRNDAQFQKLASTGSP